MLLFLLACAWTRSELYLGAGIPGGGVVDDAAFEQFLAEAVTPRFPDGYTVVEGRGRWGEDGKTIAEDSRVLVILHRGDGRDVRAIAADYVERFHQQAVLEADDPVRVRFISGAPTP